MKAAGIILLLLVWQTSFSQFIDSFDDGDFTNDPPWTGTIADFSINNGNLELSATPVTGSAYLATASESINQASWQFSLSMQFNPSSSNYTEVYLVSDSPDLSEALHGYLLRVGWTSDNISLLRQDANEKVLLLEGTIKRLDLSMVEVKILVSRSTNGEWRVQSRLATDTNWYDEGTVVDNTYYQTGYFGVKCNYTATRADKFGFDDFVIRGEPYVDQDPPKIDTVYSTSETELIVVFDEIVANASVENFMLNSTRPLTVELVENQAALNFERAHQVSNSIVVNNLRDIQGNVLFEEVYDFVHYSLGPVEYGDIVFNEILPDPEPQVDLPAIEFIEILNASDKAVVMTDWSLSDRTTQVRLPEIKLKPDSILILYKEGAVDQFPMANAIPLEKWPSLNNAEDELWLSDSAGRLVDYLSYDAGLYDDPMKAEGGWSLERVDPYLPCSGATNWRSSIDPMGGTPGSQNSVFARIEDDLPPVLLASYAFAEDSIVLFFSEPLGSLPNEVGIQGVEVRQYDYTPGFTALYLVTNPLEPGKEYGLNVIGARDCSGNVAPPINATIVYPEKAIAGDLIINEILFNPRSDRHDYLEVFNQSPRYISIQDMFLSNSDTEKEINSFKVIYPGDYLVLSKQPDEIIGHYPQANEENILEQDLPSFNNASGKAVLRTKMGVVIDSILYDETWHFAYLNDVEGIALERLSPYRPGTDQSNWASASGQHNYGTPGYINSQNTMDKTQNNLDIDPRVIVPDADGRDDFTIISLHEANDAIVTIRVFNLHGMKIITLANNELLGGTSYFTWDGTDQYGQLVPLGHYIITANLIYSNGGTITYREKIVVGTGY